MQRLIVNNFGPLRHVEIDVNPFLVLIGEQASGKSTIAKLIYFFKSLSDEMFSRYYNSPKLGIDYTNDVIFPIREKFYDVFGSTFHLPDFKIIYHFSEDRSVELSLNDEKKLYVHLSRNFFNNEDSIEMRSYKTTLINLKEEIEREFNLAKKVVLQQNQTLYLTKLADKINSIFCNKQNDSLFILAGRNATIGYSAAFEKMLAISLQQSIEEQGKRVYESKEQTIDETLMLDFVDRVDKMKQILIKLGNFEGIMAKTSGKKHKKLSNSYNLIKKVIRGQYTNSVYGERIVVEGGKYVYLRNASSGQQESIRILQDAFLSLYTENQVFRIIEEPEAHLFPEAQMYVVQLLAMLSNANENNQIIITTHSPYVLAALNNLMFAHSVGNMQQDKAPVDSLIQEDSWLNPQRVGSYRLSGGFSENIVDENLKMIKAELIDEVSTVLNQQYDDLLNILHNE